MRSLAERRRRNPPLPQPIAEDDHIRRGLERQLIELRIEHADLDASIDRLAEQSPLDELMLQRLKKRRLALRDAMARLEAALDPKEPA